jgi:hypothetical protein
MARKSSFAREKPMLDLKKVLVNPWSRQTLMKTPTLVMS